MFRGSRTELNQQQRPISLNLTSAFAYIVLFQVLFRTQFARGTMSDFDVAGYTVTVDESSGLVNPPVGPLMVAATLALISAVFLFVNNQIGYAMAVLASIVGGFVVFINQKRRSNPNYVTLEWFQLTLRIVRIITVLIALAHISMLAIEAAK